MATSPLTPGTRVWVNWFWPEFEPAQATVVEGPHEVDGIIVVTVDRGNGLIENIPETWLRIEPNG